MASWFVRHDGLLAKTQRQKGCAHHTAVRSLAYKWQRIIWKCWQTRTVYKEAIYEAALKKNKSPLVGLLDQIEEDLPDFALIGAPFAVYMLIQWSAEWLFRLRLPRLRLAWWAYAAYAVAFVLYGAVLRNLPGFEWFHISYMQPGLGL